MPRVSILDTATALVTISSSVTLWNYETVRDLNAVHRACPPAVRANENSPSTWRVVSSPGIPSGAFW